MSKSIMSGMVSICLCFEGTAPSVAGRPAQQHPNILFIAINELVLIS
jgi:hypothetical protein